MFKLQRLEITGFKSFADYTEIIFTGDGITAIVGPNGCGKSNVADAIAWVLGEQRVKHLRGGEMKDVIFQGARNRPPSGMAEVVMHMVRDEVIESEPDIEDIDSTLEKIDDRLVNLDAIIPQEQAQPVEVVATEVATENETPSDAEPATTEVVVPANKPAQKRHWRRRNLALDFAPGEAVSVTRRLYRSGESEYLLNGKICRLRDIQDLFSGTGLAGGHYAIIEQGRIGQILSAKPMDRRTIIEEAAGITKFRVRQRATEARLESARSNLSRISDIVSEIDRQVNSLRRQAAKARRYGVLREELRELLRQVYVAEDQKLATVLEETKSRLAEIAELELAIADDLAKREEAARAATQEARNLEDELTTTRAAAAEAVLRRDRQARECVYQKEQLSEIEKRKGEVTAEIEALTSRLVLIEGECRRLQQEDARLREEFDQSALLLRGAEESYGQRLAAANAAEVEIESSRSELLSQTATAERVREIARQLEATLERLSQQAEGLAREGDRAASQHAEKKIEADKFSRELGDARTRVAKLQAERETAVDAVVRGHEAVSDIEAELTRVRDEHSRASHRLESLKELDHRRAYYSPAVQLIFSPTETPRDFHFIGTLADALNVDAKWERAVEGVLGSSLQSIVVPTPDDAVRAAQWLRENNGGRASFLVAGLHGGSDEEVNTITALACRLEERPALSFGQVEGIRQDLRICDLLGAPQQLVTVLMRTLPQKMTARLAANLEDAMMRSIATGEMYVTLNGDWIASGQFVNAGDARDLEEGAGLLAFKRELRELETRAEALAREVEVASASAKDTRARLVELEDAVVFLNEAIGREEREAMAHEHTATSLEQEVERAERHMRVVGQDSARVDEERLEVESRRAQALLEAEAAETAREAAADNVIKASASLNDLRREAEIESESLAQQRAAAAAASERRRATTSELRRIEGELADFAARVQRHRMELAEMDGRSDELNLSIADLELAASTVESDRAREEEQIAELSSRLHDARRQADEFSAELSELNRRAAEVRESRAALDVQRAEAQARQTFVHENCQTELGQSLEDLARELTFPDEFDLDSSHTRVEELRTRLEGFGAVNMMALEELAEAEERLLFLTVQRQDIIEGISATEEALREIKRRSRERFRHAFEEINKNFSALFLELFGGGRGEMSLIDADDVLESGIDVVAQPPGKRLQNVLLLSGGEKAMAALALVLGIFHYRPAPFCLLDEVDAPLDEANVGRFTDKVVQMSADTQFIVITHNKRTMEMARALYGVTMEEAGVSKLVSVKFE